MRAILTINGGMGKSVFATALCKGIKKENPNCTLCVVTGYPDVFSGLDYVDMAFSHGQEHYFYDKYISDNNFMLFAHEPYLVTEHVKAQEHVIHSWFKLCSIPYDGELPEVSINRRESMFFSNKYAPRRPYMVIQTNGGGASEQDLKYSWARDIPASVVKSVISEFSGEYDIYHVRKENQIAYEGTIPVHDTYKGICWLIANSDKRLFMDSFCQHAAAGMGKRSTVLWVANSPRVFGYDAHDNILAMAETKKSDRRNSYLSKYNISGALNEFPYKDESEIFDVERVIESIRRQ